MVRHFLLPSQTKRISVLVVLIILLGSYQGLFAQTQNANTVTVAVASNFYPTSVKIAKAFEAQYPYSCNIVKGSSAVLFAQSQQGAPFDVFFSADAAKVDRLTSLRSKSRDFAGVYAKGKLNIYARATTDYVGEDCGIRQDRSLTIAIPNPQLAPYGFAAQEFLLANDLREGNKIIKASNAAQAFHYLYSGVVDYAITAASLYHSLGNDLSKFCITSVDSKYHSAIIQKKILFSPEKKAAQEFWEFSNSDNVQLIIRQDGYDI